MGRYYSGDIKGKFWFGVQSSDDAGFFGGTDYVNYYFEKDDLKDIKVGLTKCRKALGKYKLKFDKFFNKGGIGYTGYNEEMLEKAMGIPYSKVFDLLIWYARLCLGSEIYEKVKEKGVCEFQAEF